MSKLTNGMRISIAVIVLLLGLVSVSTAELASSQEMEQVCRNWLTRVTYLQGDWAGQQNPEIVGSQDLTSGDTLLARIYTISGGGFVVVPVLKEMTPIKAYSDNSILDERQEGGFLSMLREMLSSRMAMYVLKYGDLNAPQPEFGEALFGQGQRELWNVYAVDDEQFAAENMSSRMQPLAQAGPLLTSSWHQGSPYNNYCPSGYGGRTVVGCVATATVQVMKFWQWPPSGVGTHTYYWDGDDSCEGGSVPGDSLTAEFSDAYDWANIPDDCDGGCTTAQNAALAELSYEAGVAFNMDYGRCGSGASTAMAVSVYQTYFKYSPEVRKVDRIDYTLGEWFGLVQEEIDAGRPIQYRISLHSIVCDGWRDSNGKPEFHMNYGWGGDFNTWFVLDSLYCSWEDGNLCPADEEFMITHIQPQTEPIMSFVGRTVSESAGDGDGVPEAGETAEVLVSVKNQGWTADNALGQLSSSDPYVSVTAPTTTFGDSIPWGGQAVATVPFVVSVDPACPDPYVATLVLTITADGGYVSTDSMMVFVGSTEGFADSLNAGEGFWTHGPVLSGFGDEWHLDSYRVYSGSECWKMGGAGSADYSNSQDAGLVTPPFLLPSNAQLSFWHWIDAEPGSGTEAWDGGIVMISSGDGQWTQVEPEGGYPYQIVDNDANPLEGGTPCYSGNHGWSLAVFDLSEYSGVAQLMFRFGADGFVSAEGWYVDDIEVISTGCCGAYTGGFTGNADCDEDGKRNLADVSKLIDRVYLSKALLCCEENGDVNADEKINLADISRLIDHVFLSKEQTEPCP